MARSRDSPSCDCVLSPFLLYSFRSLAPDNTRAFLCVLSTGSRNLDNLSIPCSPLNGMARDRDFSKARTGTFPYPVLSARGLAYRVFMMFRDQFDREHLSYTAC